jgi:Zn-dependent protease with chaperone function
MPSTVESTRTGVNGWLAIPRYGRLHRVPFPLGVIMRSNAFVVQVLGLLIGFYLLCTALVVGLVLLTVRGFEASGVNRATILLLLVTLAGIFVVVRGVFVSTRVRSRDIVGIEVSPAEQPALWQRVRQLAELVGTRVPRRIYLVPDVNAAVWEDTRLLGLVPGARQMMVGVPLLMALRPAQLDAVLAHELGHYGNRDTRLGGLVGRTRQSVLSALRAANLRGRFELPGAAVFVAIFRWYAKVVLRVTQGASRAQEFAADRVAAQIAGPGNVIAALRDLRVIDTAFDFYLERYVAPGLRFGLMPTPPEVFGGFAALLAEPARQAELDGVRRGPRQESADPYDSHPPMAERIAVLEALPDNRSTPDTSDVRAIAILHDPDGALARVALRTLHKEVAGKQPVPWDVLAQTAGMHRVDERAGPLLAVVSRMTGRAADLVSFTELVAAGRLEEILDALPRNEAAQRAGATGRVAREHAKTELASMVSGWIAGHLVRTGRARWAHSWANIEGELRMPPEDRVELDAAIDALVAVRPDGARLRHLVRGMAVAA